MGRYDNHVETIASAGTLLWPGHFVGLGTKFRQHRTALSQMSGFVTAENEEPFGGRHFTEIRVRELESREVVTLEIAF